MPCSKNKIIQEEKIRLRRIDLKTNLLLALKQMDQIDKKLLLVFDAKIFVNVLSIGDIQRAILKNVALETPVKNILREKTRVAKQSDSISSIKETMRENRIECMLVIDENSNLIKVFFWEDVFGKEEQRKQNKLNIPVVIMAGGKGTRLQPLTNVIPKPLIPIGEKTIIEEIIAHFIKVGCNSFLLSVNYKAETIKHYFSQVKNKAYTVNYFQEEKPLGTAGSLFLIKDKIDTTFFVSNCDIIIDEDYSEILKYHQDNENELTIVSAFKHYPIPYGTIKTENGGVLTELIEKPELTFQINSGMYILEPHLLDEIPENTFFHITHLIENMQKRKGKERKGKERKGKVGVFPVSEGSWKDIGEWNEYLKFIKE